MKSDSIFEVIHKSQMKSKTSNLVFLKNWFIFNMSVSSWPKQSIMRTDGKTNGAFKGSYTQLWWWFHCHFKHITHCVIWYQSSGRLTNWSFFFNYFLHSQLVPEEISQMFSKWTSCWMRFSSLLRSLVPNIGVEVSLLITQLIISSVKADLKTIIFIFEAVIVNGNVSYFPHIPLS